MLFNTSRGRSWAGERNHTTGAGSISSPLTGFMINDRLALLVSDNSSSDSECESDAEGSTCSSSSESEVFDVIAEIKRKKAHPDRLHDELWYNDPGQVGLSLSGNLYYVTKPFFTSPTWIFCFLKHFEALPYMWEWGQLMKWHCHNVTTLVLLYTVVSVQIWSFSRNICSLQFYTKTFTWFFTLLANKSWWQYMS